MLSDFGGISGIRSIVTHKIIKKQVIAKLYHFISWKQITTGEFHVEKSPDSPKSAKCMVATFCLNIIIPYQLNFTCNFFLSVFINKLLWIRLTC